MVIQRCWKVPSESSSSTSASSTEANRSPSTIQSCSDDSNCSNQTITSMTTRIATPPLNRSDPTSSSSSSTRPTGFVTTPLMADAMLQRLRQRLGHTESPMRSLELVRISIQKAFNQEIDRIVKQFIETYFKPAVKNIKENLGQALITEETLNKMACVLLENSKELYIAHRAQPQGSGTMRGQQHADGTRATVKRPSASSYPVEPPHYPKKVFSFAAAQSTSTATATTAPITTTTATFTPFSSITAAKVTTAAPAQTPTQTYTTQQAPLPSHGLQSQLAGQMNPLPASTSTNISTNTITATHTHTHAHTHTSKNTTVAGSSSSTSTASSNLVMVQPTLAQTKSAISMNIAPVRRQIFWNTASISTTTRFVLDIYANPVFGYGTDGKERLASKHPELIRYLPDTDDREWLFTQNIIPQHNRNTRFLFLIYEELCSLRQTHELYRGKPNIDLSTILTFSVPESLVQKMKLFFVDLNIKSRGLITNSFSVGSSSQLRNALLQGASSAATAVNNTATSVSLSDAPTTTSALRSTRSFGDSSANNNDVSTTNAHNRSSRILMSSLSSSHATLTALLNNSAGQSGGSGSGANVATSTNTGINKTGSGNLKMRN